MTTRRSTTLVSRHLGLATRFFVLPLAALLAGACGSGSSGAAAPTPTPATAPIPSSDDGGNAVATLTISVATKALLVRQGASKGLEVTVTRAGWDGPVTIDLKGLSGGLSAKPVTVPAGVSAATVNVVASVTAVPHTEPVVVEARGGGLSATAELRIEARAPAGVDTSFGAQGTAELAIPASTVLVPRHLAVQADNRILVGATKTWVVGGNPREGAALYRFDEAGALDATFGAGGEVVVSDAVGTDGVGGIAIQADGAIVVAHQVADHFSVARFLPNGQPDATFGTAGVVTTRFDARDTPYGIAVEADGKIVVVGEARPAGFSPWDATLAIARYLPSGALDPSFGAGGKLTTTLKGAKATASGVSASGSDLYVVGDFVKLPNSAVQEGAIARLSLGGALDSSFGAGGVTLRSKSVVRAAVPVDDGVLFVEYTSGVGERIGRLTGTGALDTTFGTSGVTDALGSGSNGDHYANIAVEPIGRILWGRSRHGASTTLEIGAFTANGVLEDGFGTEGWLPITIAHPEIEITALTRAPDGRVVVLGSGDAVVLARFLP